MSDTVYTRSELRTGITLKSGEPAKIITKSLATVKIYDAVGGPAVAKPDDNGSLQSPTEAGEYVIVGMWKHKSISQWGYSKIEWGAPLRERGDVLEVFTENKWQPLKKFVPDSKEELINYYHEFYKRNEFPKTWVFNDFGHITCFIAKDLNRNGEFNPKAEKIHHQFFHTTPEDEALTERKDPITLSESHGCVHIKPKDIDEMIAKGYMKKNNMVYIYDYSLRPIVNKPSVNVKPPYSLHFYPGLRKLVVKGHQI